MGGSASIQCKEKNIYGHDGLMGNQIPIAVGACFAKRKPTIAIVGDSAAEEDYVLSSIGWAATKNLPILFIVEDNNLSILTEKKVRRSWEMHKVSSAFGVESYDISDDPYEIKEHLKNPFKNPCYLISILQENIGMRELAQTVIFLIDMKMKKNLLARKQF